MWPLPAQRINGQLFREARKAGWAPAAIGTMMMTEDPSSITQSPVSGRADSGGGNWGPHSTYGTEGHIRILGNKNVNSPCLLQPYAPSAYLPCPDEWACQAS